MYFKALRTGHRGRCFKLRAEVVMEVIPVIFKEDGERLRHVVQDGHWKSGCKCALEEPLARIDADKQNRLPRRPPSAMKV